MPALPVDSLRYQPISAVQEAIDAATAGDVLRLAGTCIGVASRGGTDQVAFVDRDLTLLGGHNPEDWTAPADPETWPTFLDAASAGHGVRIPSGVTAVLEGLTVRGGETTGHGAGIWSEGNLTLRGVWRLLSYADQCRGLGHRRPSQHTDQRGRRRGPELSDRPADGRGRSRGRSSAGLLSRRLGDRVWHDLDGDAIQDPGEPGVAGVRVDLRSSAGTLLDSAVTLLDGTYDVGPPRRATSSSTLFHRRAGSSWRRTRAATTGPTVTRTP